MNKHEIVEMILGNLPAIIACVGYILCTFKVIGSFNLGVAEIKAMTSFKKLEDQMKVLLDQNYELAKQVKELTTELNEKNKETKEE